MGMATSMMNKRPVRFLLVGIWNTIFGYLVFIGMDFLFSLLFSKRFVAYMTAAVVANILAVINAYIFHKWVTFRSTTHGMDLLFEFMRFSSTYLVTFLLNLVLLPFFVEVVHLSPMVAGALVICCCTFISYLGHSRFSFKHRHLR